MQFSDVCIGCWLVDFVKACDACSWIIGFSAAVISFATYCLWRLRTRVLRENQHIRNMAWVYKNTEDMTENENWRCFEKVFGKEESAEDAKPVEEPYIRKCGHIEKYAYCLLIDDCFECDEERQERFILQCREEEKELNEESNKEILRIRNMEFCTCTVPLKREKGKRK